MGKTGNPVGRPPIHGTLKTAFTWADVIDKKMRERVWINEKKVLKDGTEKIVRKLVTYKYAMICAAADAAVNGDVKAHLFLAERCDGKPFQQVDHTTKGNQFIPAPIVMNFEPADTSDE